MKIAVDPGHGMSNRKAGVFDPGATAHDGIDSFAEADIVLRYGHTLRKVLLAAGAEVFMTRTSSADPAPVSTRAGRAASVGCELFVSLHLNADDNVKANGVEIQYRDDEKDKPLADRLLRRLLQVTGFKDHGNDRRNDLAVLKFAPGPAVLVELGFITNTADRTALLDGSRRDAICEAIAAVLLGG